MSTDLYLYCTHLPGYYEIEQGSDFAPKEGGFIKLESIEHQIRYPAADIRPSAFGGGHRVGQLEHGTVLVTKLFDATSVSILKRQMEMTQLEEVRIFGSRPLKEDSTGSNWGASAKKMLTGEGLSAQTVLDIKLTKVLITNFQYEIGSQHATEKFELRYSSIGWRVHTVKHGEESLSGHRDSVYWNGETNEVKEADNGFVDDADKLFKAAGF